MIRCFITTNKLSESLICCQKNGLDIQRNRWTAEDGEFHQKQKQLLHNRWISEWLENDIINKLVNFGKWLFWLKMIIGFPKAVSIL